MEKLKTGLYAVNSTNYTFSFLYIVSVEYKEYPQRPYGVKEWRGIEYTYYNFIDKCVYRFNQDQDDFVASLVPITNIELVKTAKEIIKNYKSWREQEALEIVESCQFNVKG